jgi:hypothetical protein
LFRLLVNNPSHARKRLALVTDGEDPVAVVGLRRRNLHWDLITEGVVPAGLPPCEPGREIDALSALGLFVWVNEWEAPVPASRRVHFVQHEGVYRVSTRIDLDAFWREHHNTRRLRKAANRCSRLGEVSMEVDAPGAATWTIDRWEERWSGHDWSETVAAEDIRAAAAYLQPLGRYHSFRLLIDGRPAAGINASVRGAMLVIANSGRDRAFDRVSAGVHLDEHIFRWATESPYNCVDLGGGFDFKALWSDATGVRARFSIAPAHLTAARYGLVMARRVKDFVASRNRDGLESARWA